MSNLDSPIHLYIYFVTDKWHNFCDVSLFRHQMFEHQLLDIMIQYFKLLKVFRNLYIFFYFSSRSFFFFFLFVSFRFDLVCFSTFLNRIHMVHNKLNYLLGTYKLCSSGSSSEMQKKFSILPKCESSESVPEVLRK